MANDVLWVRLSPEEKHTLKILAAEADMNLTGFVLDVLRKFTALEARRLILVKSIPDEGRNNPNQGEEPAAIA